MDLNGPSNSQVQRIWRQNTRQAVVEGIRDSRENDVELAKRLQGLMGDKNKGVKGNWVTPEIEEILGVLNGNAR